MFTECLSFYHQGILKVWCLTCFGTQKVFRGRGAKMIIGFGILHPMGRDKWIPAKNPPVGQILLGPAKKLGNLPIYSQIGIYACIQSKDAMSASNPLELCVICRIFWKNKWFFFFDGVIWYQMVTGDVRRCQRLSDVRNCNKKWYEIVLKHKVLPEKVVAKEYSTFCHKSPRENMSKFCCCQ